MTNTQYIKGALETLNYALYGKDLPVTLNETIQSLVCVQTNASRMMERLASNSAGVRKALLLECESKIDVATNHVAALEKQIKALAK
jgi:hypothetical protein